MNSISNGWDSTKRKRAETPYFQWGPLSQNENERKVYNCFLSQVSFGKGFLSLAKLFLVSILRYDQFKNFIQITRTSVVDKVVGHNI